MESAAIFFFLILLRVAAQYQSIFTAFPISGGLLNLGGLQRKRIAKNRILSLIIRTNKRTNFMQEKLRAEKILIETQAL